MFDDFITLCMKGLIVEYANISGNLWPKITIDATPDSTGPIGHIYLFQGVWLFGTNLTDI